MRKILTKPFFERSELAVAEELLGKYVVRAHGDTEISSMIVDTEAYGGAEDLASHARHGNTARNAPMFDEGGMAYIYLVYGMHYLLNATARAKGTPAAVLIRGTKDVTGPGRLTTWLNVDKQLNHKRLIKENGLWIEDRGKRISTEHIQKMPRVGIDYAGVWAHKPYRFVLKENEH